VPGDRAAERFLLSGGPVQAAGDQQPEEAGEFGGEHPGRGGPAARDEVPIMYIM
jgi:hypothetical protein